MKFDASFMLSLKKDNIAPPVFEEDTEEVVMTAEELEMERARCTASTSSADASALGEGVPRGKSKSAKRKKKLAAAAAAAAAAVAGVKSNGAGGVSLEVQDEALSISRSASAPQSSASNCQKRTSSLSVAVDTPKKGGSKSSPGLSRTSSEPPLSAGTPGRWKPAMAQSEDGWDFLSHPFLKY